MRLSLVPLQTLREDPSDAEIPSHRLLARAGYIQKLSSGIYMYSPLMWRTLRKISQIVREELEREGAHEMLLPILQPREIWDESGRWSRYLADGLLFHLEDGKGAQLCLGPTHEEVITTYVNKVVTSYRQLPFNLFQVQEKFRDEIRPRFGLMRGREFLMKDAYSFDADLEGLNESYAAMNRAYHRIFQRCGLDFVAVDADAGAIGGSGSQEFMVVADNGEDTILIAEDGSYAANVEKADSLLPPAADAGPPCPLRKESTPSIRTVDELCEFFALPAARMAKTLLYKVTFSDRDETIAVMMRGDLEINEIKLVNALGAVAVSLAAEDEVRSVTNAEVGFAGPIGLPEEVRVLADLSVRGMTNLLVGCCETDFHCLDANPGRDFPEPEYHDLRRARAGEASPTNPDVKLVEKRGIEVGHIFKLGTKYSEAMHATFLDQDGKQKPFVMGCYGIGISRTAAAAVEQNFDEAGIIWPQPIAPFEVVVTILDGKKREQVEAGGLVYDVLRSAGVDVCLDDRVMSPGVKFKDLDLLGFPIRIIVGRRAGEGIVEFSRRSSREEKSEVAVGDVVEAVGRDLGWPRRSTKQKP
ncbi:MAG: proline--tRNA ligase [Candidatus Eisenbacteria bacterium]|uniref:Proline--tRNA ligase n=1 Tax=Eiseniibacteriota bacterium TaxID=2212470 RepID=A0A956NHQ8_UNCEI|nr:proline--tRNA ligase [Candidatus Eisenbacteria bacterium]